MSLNRVILMGRLTRDPELRRTQSGMAVTAFSIAVDRDFKDKDTGERATDFIEIVAWRNTAEFVSKYFSKGRMAVVEGKLQVRDWKDQNGNNRRTTEVIAENVYFGDSKKDGDQSGGNQPPRTQSAGKPVDLYPSAGEFGEINDDGELPF